MRINLSKLKGLLITALVAGAVWSCQDEKPQINYPEPVIPQKEFKHLDTVTPDTLSFNEGDSAVFRMRTIPYNLLSRDSLTIQVSDTSGAKYPFADIKSLTLNADSVWNIVLDIKEGMKNGDIISIMVADKDTVIYSDQTVLHMILKAVPKLSYSMTILNDSVSGYISKGTATIRLRTVPWDMLYADSTTTLSVTDTAGNALDEYFQMDSLRFLPADSAWFVYIKNLKRTDSALFKVTIDCPDTVMVSRPILMKKVSFAMSSVKVANGTALKYSSSNETYSYCFPTSTNFTQMRIMFSHTGDKVTLGDSLLHTGKYNIMDLSKTITVSVWKYDVSKQYKIHIYNTGLPVVRINTNGQSVNRRDTWVEGNTMRVELADGTLDFEGTISLKGRGNGTWTETQKKPYAIRLDEKAKILGMHKQKRWILLANYKDRTLLRNEAALWISRQTELPYTVSGQFVELVWNGEHMGNYYLCEQARIDNHRIDIVSPNLTEPEKGGIFMEIDAFLDYSSSDRADKPKDLGFWSTGANGRYNLPYIFKDPDEDENGHLLTKSSATYTYMFNYVKEMEDAIYGLKTNPNDHRWQQYLDMDAAVDYLLIQELTMNHDSYNTWPAPGPHSGFIYKDSCGPICFGPVWDFDYHTFTLKEVSNGGGWNWGGGGNSTSSESPRLRQWELIKMDNKDGNKYYFADLVKYDPQFKARLKQRWNQYKNVWKEGLPAYIDQMANYIRLSESYNWSKWGLNNPNGKQNGDEDLSFQEAVNAMKQAFQIRWQWMDENLPNL